MEAIEGETHIISLIFDDPISDSLKIRVSLESLKGIWVLDWLVKAEIQCPNFDKLLLIDLSSAILTYFSFCGRSYGILNFSEPAKSTTRS